MAVAISGAKTPKKPSPTKNLIAKGAAKAAPKAVKAKAAQPQVVKPVAKVEESLTGRWKIIRRKVLWKRSMYHVGDVMPTHFTEKDVARHQYSRRFEQIK